MDTKSKRIYAFIIDAFVVSIISSIINFFLMYLKNGLIDNKVNIILGFNSSLVLFFTYFVFFDIINEGVTVGKSIMEIKLIDENSSSKISTKKLIKRSLLKTFSIFILPVAILLFLLKDQFTIQDFYLGLKSISR